MLLGAGPESLRTAKSLVAIPRHLAERITNPYNRPLGQHRACLFVQRHTGVSYFRASRSFHWESSVYMGLAHGDWLLLMCCADLCLEWLTHRRVSRATSG